MPRATSPESRFEHVNRLVKKILDTTPKKVLRATVSDANRANRSKVIRFLSIGLGRFAIH
jgi:hypothetical protein